MVIKNITKYSYFLVETDETEYNTYRRAVNGSRDTWEQLYGDSWESYYDDGTLEALFQQEIKIKND